MRLEIFNLELTNIIFTCLSRPFSAQTLFLMYSSFSRYISLYLIFCPGEYLHQTILKRKAVPGCIPDHKKLDYYTKLYLSDFLCLSNTTESLCRGKCSSVGFSFAKGFGWSL